MKNSSNLYIDLMVGLFFFAGVFSFMSGAFGISTMLFGLAALSSNLDFRVPVRA